MIATGFVPGLSKMARHYVHCYQPERALQEKCNL